jgi:hypothetical protein
MPDSTVCSAQTTPPFPPSSRNAPAIVALRHCFRVGGTAPRERAQAYRINPEMRNRVPPMTNGGMVSTAYLIARYVDPHTV